MEVGASFQTFVRTPMLRARRFTRCISRGACLPATPVYQKGVQWLLRNQLADGSWFVPTRAVPVQPHTFESFPNGWHQFVSDAGSCWATMALLFTLPDKPRSSN